jgi:hypothetical protein
MKFGALWAIVEDTWRQSKQQVVFLLLAGFMLLYGVGVILGCRVFVTSNGTYVLGVALQDSAEVGLEAGWDALYRQAVAGDDIQKRLDGPRQELERYETDARAAQSELLRARLEGATPEAQKPLEEKFEQAKRAYEEKQKAFTAIGDEVLGLAQAKVDAASPGRTPLEKGVEVWLANASSILVLLSMLGFIAASAGYFPAMLGAGAIDILVSKPVARWQVFFGKYLGGLVLYSLALLATYVVIWLGMGIKTGVWHTRLFAAIPVTLFCAALLNALVAWLGVFTRSTALAIVMGYAYYLVLETVVSLVQSVSAMRLGVAWLDRVSEISRWVFPGFGRLREAAGAAVIDVPIFDPQPLWVGAAWMLLLLGSSYAWFRRLDF